MRVERPLLTPSMKETHFHQCKALLNDLKKARANCIVIFSDEKTWTVDPVRNRQNDRYLSFANVDESVRTLATTKHPASIMSLGFVGSDGKAAPLVWFPVGYRLTGADYVKALKENLLPWVQANYPDGNVVFMQDEAPAHTSNKAQVWLGEDIPFWGKKFDCRGYSPDANPLDFTFWVHVESKACTICHPNVGSLRAAVDRHWNLIR